MSISDLQSIEAIALNGGLALGSQNILERNLDVLLGQVHLGSKSAVGLPLAGCTGGGLLQHLVDLLEGEALGLGDEEVGEEDCHCMSNSKGCVA